MGSEMCIRDSYCIIYLNVTKKEIGKIGCAERVGKTVAVKKEKAKKHIFLRLAVVAFGVYTIATLVTQQIEIREQKAYLENIQQQCEAQEMENLEVERLLSQGDDKSYVEKVARDKLDYAYPDEKVFVDASGS